MRLGDLLLSAAGGLAVALLLLGLLPWGRSGTPWRPRQPAREQLARAHWDEETIARGREFRSRGYRYYFLGKGTVGLVLVAALAFGWHLGLRRLPGAPGVGGSTLSLVVCTIGLSAILFPLRLAAFFNRRDFGLGTQSVPDWLIDYGKSLGLSVVTTALVGLVFFLLLTRAPRFWPLAGTAAAGVGGFLFAWVLPLLIAPLFNTFTPLRDPELRARFLDLAERGGVAAGEVFVADASRRTRSVNAYFCGFGPSRRIVVYDTLIESLSGDEAALVVAHEVGHWRLGHIVKGIGLGTLAAGFALLLLRWILAAVFRGAAFGLHGPSDAALPVLLLLLFWVGGLLALPVENAVSRRFETEADRFALELSADAETHVRVEEELARRNLADVVPPPLIETLLFTHPANLDRIALADDHAKR